MFTHAVDLARGGWRYARGLRGFLSETITTEVAAQQLQEQLRRRTDSFLHVLEHGIYANPASPYSRLLLHAGFQFEKVRTMLIAQGPEATLSHLYDAGVYLTLEEFKGRSAVKRPGLEFRVTERDFDNPLLTVHYQGSTGGSRGGGNRVPLDFDFLAYEALSWAFHLQVQEAEHRPTALWLAQPPSPVGLRSLFQFARTGRSPDEWFSPNRPSWNRQAMQARAMMAYTVIAGRLSGRRIVRPVFADESAVVDFLSRATASGAPGVVVSLVSPAVRVCLAAEAKQANIRGTVFFVAGEPYTDGKAAVFRRVDARCVPTYAMQEAGGIARACGSPESPDEMHMMTEKLAVVQRPLERLADFGVEGLFYTSLLSSSPKLMLNVESGDYGVLSERDCGCPWQNLGFTTHISDVRSYEKLTSESVTFMGSMLFRLLEEVLPSRFGGNPTDYQIVEEEEDGLPRVSLLVSPRLGVLDENAIIEVALAELSSTDWSRRMAEQWRHGGTFRVDRREPHATMAAKILPLHILSAKHGA